VNLRQFVSQRGRIRRGADRVRLGPRPAVPGVRRLHRQPTPTPAPCSSPAACCPPRSTAVADGGEIWMLDSANYNTGLVDIAKSGDDPRGAGSARQPGLHGRGERHQRERRRNQRDAAQPRDRASHQQQQRNRFLRRRVHAQRVRMRDRQRVRRRHLCHLEQRQHHRQGHGAGAERPRVSMPAGWSWRPWTGCNSSGNNYGVLL
jgi:hypothetical protein